MLKYAVPLTRFRCIEGYSSLPNAWHSWKFLTLTGINHLEDSSLSVLVSLHDVLNHVLPDCPISRKKQNISCKHLPVQSQRKKTLHKVTTYVQS